LCEIGGIGSSGAGINWKSKSPSPEEAADTVDSREAALADRARVPLFCASSWAVGGTEDNGEGLVAATCELERSAAMSCPLGRGGTSDAIVGSVLSTLEP